MITYTKKSRSGGIGKAISGVISGYSKAREKKEREKLEEEERNRRREREDITFRQGQEDRTRRIAKEGDAEERIATQRQREAKLAALVSELNRAKKFNTTEGNDPGYDQILAEIRALEAEMDPDDPRDLMATFDERYRSEADEEKAYQKTFGRMTRDLQAKTDINTAAQKDLIKTSADFGKWSGGGGSGGDKISAAEKRLESAKRDAKMDLDNAIKAKNAVTYRYDRQRAGMRRGPELTKLGLQYTKELQAAEAVVEEKRKAYEYAKNRWAAEAGISEAAPEAGHERTMTAAELEASLVAAAKVH